MEEAVRFDNGAGLTLRGVLHRPDRPIPAGMPGLAWLSAGQKPRTGAWRMNVVVARRMAALGVPVLRFDYRGVGDSDGERHHGRAVMDYYGIVQTGGLRDDVVAGARFLMEEARVDHVVLGGLCGGAASALFAAPLLGRRARALVLIDLPVTISSAARQQYLEAHPEELVRARPDEADTVLLLYLRKILDADAWRRFASGESNPKLFVEAARVKARASLERYLPKLPPSLRARADALLGPAIGDAADAGADDREASAREVTRGEVRNELIVPAFREVLAAGQRVRFLNSSSYHPVFMGFFGQQELGDDRDVWRRRGFDLSVAPDTNHIFSLEHSQRCLFDVVESTIRDAASARGTSPSAGA